MGRFNLYIEIGGAAAALLLGAGAWLLSHRKTAEQRERERRTRINHGGRITDGTVLDVREINANGQGKAYFLFYRYHVAGVSYEASQDVTSLRHAVNLQTYRIGLPASVKYDPQNPVNSIVIAEGWSGLRR